MKIRKLLIIAPIISIAPMLSVSCSKSYNGIKTLYDNLTTYKKTIEQDKTDEKYKDINKSFYAYYDYYDLVYKRLYVEGFQVSLIDHYDVHYENNLATFNWYKNQYQKIDNNETIVIDEAHQALTWEKRKHNFIALWNHKYNKE